MVNRAMKKNCKNYLLFVKMKYKLLLKKRYKTVGRYIPSSLQTIRYYEIKYSKQKNPKISYLDCFYELF